MGARETFIPRFRKIVALFDSDRQGEREAAFVQALRLCAENEVQFCDACTQAYGSSGDDLSDELSAKQETIDELQQDNQTLADAIDALREELEIAKGSGGSMVNETDRLLASRIWSFPQARIGVPLALLAVRFWFVTNVFMANHERDSIDRWLWISINIMYGPIVFFSLWAWTGAEFKKSGAGVVVLKTLIVIPGIYASLAAFSGSTDPRLWLGSEVDERSALLWLVATAALTISNLCSWLAKQFTYSNHAPFRRLREWFA